MALRDHTGAPLSQSAFAAKAPNDSAAPTTATFTENIYEDIVLPGTKENTGRRLKYRKGQTILASVRDAAYYAAATAASISPATGPAAGGTVVTITGTNLLDVTGVTFGGTAATDVDVLSSTKVKCKTPAHATGAVTVVVQTPAGDVTKTTFFTYA
jgi:hypothetical protein